MYIYHIGKLFDGENFDKLDEWLVIHQHFPANLFLAPMEPTINLSKFHPSPIHQSITSLNFCTIQ